MSEKDRSLSFDGELPADQVADYLEDLARSFRSGHVPVAHGEQQVVLTPAPLLRLKVKARAKDKHHELRLELDWEPVVKTDPLRIGLRAAETPASARTTQD